ncbi:MAG: serine O-acetyltransferase EpsC [PVC group bacterium]
MTAKRQKRETLADTVDRIIESYNRCGGINHIRGPNLPSRGEIVETLESLITVIFPGFFTRGVIDKDNVRYWVGTQCAEIYPQLEDQINKCFRYFCRNWKSCRPDEIRCLIRGRESCLTSARKITRALFRELPSLREVLFQDVRAHFTGDPAAKSMDEIILAYPGLFAITVYRIAHILWKKKVPLLPRIMSEYAHTRTGIDIHPGARIGHHFMIDHGTGVVIGETTVIGDHVRIYQGVTLGALSVPADAGLFRSRKRHPTIKDNVTIYAGATILGGRTVIGRGAVIGGNVWLTRSIPPRTTVFGELPVLAITREMPYKMKQ